MVDKNGLGLGWYVGSGSLIDNDTLWFEFDGSTIGRNGQDGPYALKGVSIFQVTGGNTSLLLSDALTTNAYSYLEFEDSQSDLYLPLIIGGAEWPQN